MGCRGWTHTSRVFFSAAIRSEVVLSDVSSLTRQKDLGFASSIPGTFVSLYQSANTWLMLCPAFSHGRRASEVQDYYYLL